MDSFNFPVRVYYEDTDAQGVVYYANYLKYLERARTEWLRECALPVVRLANEHKIVFVVRRIEIDYLYPARLDNWLDVSVAVLSVSAAGFDLEQKIHHQDKMHCSAWIKMVCVDAFRFKPVRIPGPLKQQIFHGKS